MITRKQEILNPTGLHARPAAQLVNLVKKFKCDMEIRNGSAVVNPKSILSVLAGELSYGRIITITASGEDEQEAIDAVCGFISNLKE